jgi:cobalt-zinc-cadmium efflux system protein
MTIRSACDVRHVHLWRPAEERLALEAHVAVSEADLRKVTELKRTLKDKLRQRFSIDHATLEFEMHDDVRHARDVLPQDE